jgi:indolepyruvate ferredoxin oxidoreductase alpha subunit
MCIDMGSSTSIAHGAQKVFEKFGEETRAVATFGDSTFFHSGINAVLNVVYNKSNTVICILDNRITGMTGQQENPGSGMTLQGDITTQIDIETVVKALGINQIRVVNPQKLQEVRGALKWALELNEPSVIITKWPCVLKKLNQEEKDKYTHNNKHMKIDEAMCNGCRVCLNIGCPALSFDKVSEKATIDAQTCVGCEVCGQVCGYDAIVKGELEHA